MGALTLRRPALEDPANPGNLLNPNEREPSGPEEPEPAVMRVLGRAVFV